MKRKLVVQYEFPHNEWFVTHFFHSARKCLVDQNSDIDFTFINSGELSDRNSYSKNSAHMMTITNPDNGKYILLSFWDKTICVFNKFLWDPSKMVQLLCSSGLNKEEYDNFFSRNPPDATPINYEQVVTPFTYFPYTIRAARIIEDIILKRNRNSLKDIMVFRGALYNERLFLKENLKEHNDIIIDSIQESYKDAPEYLNEHLENLCALSINGAAEICNRDIELFGLGMPVIRTELNLEFYNRLIPDYHYISAGKCIFRCGTTFMDNNELKNNIIEKFNFYKNNKEQCLFIGENARRWYLENCTINSMTSLFQKLIKLNLLFE